jgi:hypothetical protein
LPDLIAWGTEALFIAGVVGMLHVRGWDVRQSVSAHGVSRGRWARVAATAVLAIGLIGSSLAPQALAASAPAGPAEQAGSGQAEGLAFGVDPTAIGSWRYYNGPDLYPVEPDVTRLSVRFRPGFTVESIGATLSRTRRNRSRRARQRDDLGARLDRSATAGWTHAR